MDKLVVALDVFTFDEMKEIVNSLGSTISTFKIGHQLFTSEGPRTVSYLKSQNKKVFLDLKLHEIPNSVAQAVHSAGRHGVDIVTVHASGGRKMMEAAVDASNQYPDMKIFALTVVTGLDEKDLSEIGFNEAPIKQALSLAKLAKEAGCHGIIASPQEAQSLRKTLGQDFLIITPGIRPSSSEKHDESRVGTPSESIKAGASMIIVGRPIIKAKNPGEVAGKIKQEISAIVT